MCSGMYEGRRPEEPRHVFRTKREHVSVCISSDETTKVTTPARSPDTVGAFWGPLWGTIAGISLRSSG